MFNSNCGCNNQNVVDLYSCEYIPCYNQVHTHFVNNHVKNYVETPVYTQSYETKVFDNYMMGSPIYQSPMNTNFMNQYPNYYQNQGNLNQVNPFSNPFNR